MATIETIYTGDLRTEMTHVSSGEKIFTDAPIDNKGKGASFSPTDLVAGALGACMMTIMGMVAQTHGIDVIGTRISTTKIMSQTPRRIGEIIVEFNFPSDYTDKQKRLLENAAATCPVGFSLHPEVKQTIVYNYGR